MKKLMILLVIALLASPGCAVKKKVVHFNDTYANRLLAVFPKKIPDVCATKRVEVQNAKFVLVHINQVHFAPDISRSDSIAVFKTQEEIFRIISYLNEQGFCNSVYEEGQVIEADDLKLSNFNPKPNLNPIIPENWKPLATNERNALERLTTKIKILPTESLFLQITAFLMETKNPHFLKLLEESNYLGMGSENLYKEIVLGHREDFLLKIIANNNGPGLAFTTFGCGHDFSDNIDSWNENHPDQKFSLIEIVPSCLYGLKNVMEKINNE